MTASPQHGAELELDLRGLKCPLPVLHAGRALREVAAGTRLTILTTDPLASLDLANLAREEGAVYESCGSEATVTRHLLWRP